MKVINPWTFLYKDVVGINLRTQIKLFKRNDISFVSVNWPNFDSGHLASWIDRKFNLCHSGLTSLTSHELWSSHKTKILRSYAVPTYCTGQVFILVPLRLRLSWAYSIPLALGALTLMRNLELQVTQPPSFFQPHVAFFSKVLDLSVFPQPRAFSFFLEGNPLLSLPLRLLVSLNSVLLTGFCSLGGKKGKLENKLSFPFLSCY